MFKALIIFTLGVIVGGYLVRSYDQREVSVSKPNPSSPTVRKDTGLTKEQIQEELKRTGQVVRQGARAAGERIADARIITVIKAKMVLDRDLSALDIKVDCTNGEVTLTGTVASEALVAHAIALAVETDGVTNVVARLAIKAPPAA